MRPSFQSILCTSRMQKRMQNPKSYAFHIPQLYVPPLKPLRCAGRDMRAYTCWMSKEVTVAAISRLWQPRSSPLQFFAFIFFNFNFNFNNHTLFCDSRFLNIGLQILRMSFNALRLEYDRRLQDPSLKGLAYLDLI